MISSCKKCSIDFSHRKKSKEYCDRCHRSIGGPCVKCNKVDSYRWYIKKSTCSNCYLKTYPKDKLAGYSKKYYENNKEKWNYDEETKKHRKEYMKKYWASNKEKKKQYSKKYYEKTKESRKESSKAYRYEYVRRSSSKRLMNFNTVMRQKRTKIATPFWANVDKIKDVYKNRPEGFEVDHIVPIKNDNVCGLHIHNNLQYLTITENRSKHNKFIIEN